MRTFIISSTLAAGALALLASGAVAQDAPFCMQKKDGSAHCVYQTIAACEQAKQADAQADPNDLCLIRSLVDGWRVQGGNATSTGQGPGSDMQQERKGPE